MNVNCICRRVAPVHLTRFETVYPPPLYAFFHWRLTAAITETVWSTLVTSCLLCLIEWLTTRTPLRFLHTNKPLQTVDAVEHENVPHTSLPCGAVWKTFIEKHPYFDVACSSQLALQGEQIQAGIKYQISVIWMPALVFHWSVFRWFMSCPVKWFSVILNYRQQIKTEEG